MYLYHFTLEQTNPKTSRQMHRFCTLFNNCEVKLRVTKTVFISVHITGKYRGRVFEDREVGFVLGEGSEVGVVEGVEIGLRRFTCNEKARLRVVSMLAYGHEGCPQYDIPPDADLDYEVTLLDYVKVCHWLSIAVSE